MVRTILLAALASTLAVALVSCGGDDDEDDAAAGDSVTVELSPQSDSGQSGEAILTPVDGDATQVVVELSGGPDNAQPAHIHTGTCDELGGVAHPLTDLEGGSSETQVEVSLDELQSGQFAINAHQSADEIDVYTACGEIPSS